MRSFAAMSITVAHESCVRLLSIKSECARCEEACSFDALSFVNSILRLKTPSCTSCGACVGVCPTGAITLFSFEGLASIVASKDEFTFGANEDGFLPEAFSSDEFFALAAISKNGVFAELEDGSLALSRIEEANRLLSSFGVQKKIKTVPASQMMQKESLKDDSKRALFRLFTKEGVKEKSDSLKNDDEFMGEKELTIDYARLRAKKIPFKRELFLGVVEKLENADKNGNYALSFASDKHIDDTCDNCSLCYNLCPSGALEVTGMKNAIVFSPHLCLKCRLCEDVCETKSISSLPSFTLLAFKEKQKKLLKKFKARLCTSCGAVFSGDDEECHRCKAESEDARELLGL